MYIDDLYDKSIKKMKNIAKLKKWIYIFIPLHLKIIFVQKKI